MAGPVGSPAARRELVTARGGTGDRRRPGRCCPEWVRSAWMRATSCVLVASVGGNPPDGGGRQALADGGCPTRPGRRPPKDAGLSTISLAGLSGHFGQTRYDLPVKFAVVLLVVWSAVSIPAILLLGRCLAVGARSDPADGLAAGTLPDSTPIESSQVGPGEGVLAPTSAKR